MEKPILSYALLVNGVVDRYVIFPVNGRIVADG